MTRMSYVKITLVDIYGLEMSISPYSKLVESYEFVFDIPWPTGEIMVENKLIPTSDPNELVRPMLQSELGHQHEAWGWCITPHTRDHISIGVHNLEDAIRLRLYWSK